MSDPSPTTPALDDPGPAIRCQRSSRDLFANAPPEPWRGGAVRLSFIARPDGGALPAMVQLARTASKGATALRLELAFLWLASLSANQCDVAEMPSDALAALVGLGDTASERRRLDVGLATLEERGFLERLNAGRGARKVALHREDEGTPGHGAGAIAPYRRPAGGSSAWGDRFVVLPDSFWLEGWAVALPSSALGVLLALLFMRSTTARRDEPVFLSESLRAQRFGFSHQYFYEGRRVLQEFGVVRLRSLPLVGSSRPDQTRWGCEIEEWIFNLDVTGVPKRAMWRRR